MVMHPRVHPDINYVHRGGGIVRAGKRPAGKARPSENIRILRSGKAGISITSNDGSVIDGVHYKKIKMEKTFVPIFMKISDVACVPEGAYKRGTIRNVVFENCDIEKDAGYDTRIAFPK